MDVEQGGYVPEGENEKKPKRVKDVDMAQEMAEAEIPLRDLLLNLRGLVKNGVSRDEIEKKIKATFPKLSKTIDDRTREIERAYEVAKKIADHNMIGAAMTPNSKYSVDLHNIDRGTNKKALEILEQRISGSNEFKIIRDGHGNIDSIIFHG